MTYPEIILQEIHLGRNSVRAIQLSQQTLMAEDIRAVVRKLLYRGQIDRVSTGKYKIPEEGGQKQDASHPH